MLLIDWFFVYFFGATLFVVLDIGVFRNPRVIKQPHLAAWKKNLISVVFTLLWPITFVMVGVGALMAIYKSKKLIKEMKAGMKKTLHG